MVGIKILALSDVLLNKCSINTYETIFFKIERVKGPKQSFLHFTKSEDINASGYDRLPYII